MEFNLRGVSVMLAMPVHRDICAQTVVALIATANTLRERGIPYDIQIQQGGSIIQSARSKCVHYFLKSSCNRLFWIDSDIVCHPDDVLRLLALSTVKSVICAAYPAKHDPVQFFLNADSEVEADEYGCIKLTGLGLGFACIQREPIERLAANARRLRFAGEDEPMADVFRCDAHNGEFRGEDMAFFADLANLGHPCWADPTVELGHVGTKIYTGSLRSHLVKGTDNGSD